MPFVAASCSGAGWCCSNTFRARR